VSNGNVNRIGNENNKKGIQDETAHKEEELKRSFGRILTGVGWMI
jgi:hypothetical protein